MNSFLKVISAVAISTTLASTADAASYSFSTADSPFYGTNPANSPWSSDLNQGWWSSGWGGLNDLSNVVVGDSTNYLYRNFFTFDLSGLSLAPNEEIVSASFSGFTYTIAVAGGLYETMELYDVSTDAAILNYNVGVNPAIYEDLGTGNSYGSHDFYESDSDKDFSMELNGFGIADMYAAQGGFFSIGGALATLDQSGQEEWVFAFSHVNPMPYTLSIETQISAVPLPAALPLYGAGLAVMGFAGWRKKRKAAA